MMPPSGSSKLVAAISGVVKCATFCMHLASQFAMAKKVDIKHLATLRFIALLAVTITAAMVKIRKLGKLI